MTYIEAVNYIWSTPSPSEDRLNVLKELLARLGNPHLGMKYVHVAGTNGKGSVCAFSASILRSSGIKTGLYISPHLDRINERISINGEEISDSDFARLTSEAAEAVSQLEAEQGVRPTIFGLITAIAYLYFKRNNCKIVVLEVGMGGRLDATNLIEDSEVSAITNIGFDHTEFLGNTIAEIAAEKAGIIKNNGDVVLYKQSDEAEAVIKGVCAVQEARIRNADWEKAQIRSMTPYGTEFDYENYSGLRIGLPGLYQVRNAVTAVEIAEVLRERGWQVSEETIRRGLEAAVWPGRLEMIGERPYVYVDGTHNPQGAAALAESLGSLYPNRRFILVAGMLADKDYSSAIEPMAKLARSIYTVTPGAYRSLSASELAIEFEKYGVSAKAVSDIPSALDEAIGEADTEDVVCIFGSLYQIAEVKAYFRERRTNDL